MRISPHFCTLFIAGFLFLTSCELDPVNPVTPPEAKFTVTNDGCYYPCTVSFANQSTNATSYLWDFGDGVTSTEKDPDHLYDDDGTYTVKLTALGDAGTEDEATTTVTIQKPRTFATFFGNLNEIEENGNDVLELDEGGYVVVGHQEKSPNLDNDGFIVRFDANGQVVWNTAVGGTSYDVFNGVVRASDGGFMVVGTTYSSGAGGSDMYVCKFNSNGSHLFTKTYGGTEYDYGNSIIAVNNGYVLVGAIPDINFQQDVFLVKIDLNGNVIWQKMLDGGNYESGTKIIQTADGGFAITGFSSAGNNTDMMLIKTNANGDKLFEKLYGGAEYESGNGILEYPGGGFVIVGATASFGQGDQDAYIVRTDASGNELWSFPYGVDSYDWFNSIALAPDGGLVACGTGTQSLLVYLLKIDNSGTKVWERYYDSYYATSIKATRDNGFIITGARNNPTDSEEDIYLIKTDGDGNVN
ncbi:MAG: PKD domain-containing protein [Bacteroidia bacterium]|nr:PKD domain-containing protein [Bacteroidia bacterium]